jgi:hypothetical protein
LAYDPNKTHPLDLPYGSGQNPAPNPAEEGQAYLGEKRQLTQEILAAFRRVLPSNYVAQTTGPWYSIQFQAMAEQLAEIQISSTEVLKDSAWDFTRPDFLWQMLGSLVFPDATLGIPQIEGDLAYRDFLQKMVLFLLQGATRDSLVGGLEALDPDFVVEVVERYLDTPPRNPNGGYTLLDQFTIDVFVETLSGGFPEDPFRTQTNAQLVLSALKPAHVLYSYSYLFRDAFEKVADDGGGLSLDIDSYYYEDLRKWCLGAERIEGSLGTTLQDRTLFSDPSYSFSSIRRGALLKVLTGPNAGQYRVTALRVLVSGEDPTPTPYTLSVGGGGSLVALTGEVVFDAGRDWGALPLDTQLTILSGPNAGTYRLDTVLGSTGGPIGSPGVSGNRVRLSPSILKLDRRMPTPATSQSYRVGVDRLGVTTPRPVSGEDVSQQFYL